MLTAVLAAGSPPAHEKPLKILREADRLVACDGAWRTAIALGRKPDAIVGDGDSLNEGDIAEIEALGIHLEIVEEQETNDLSKAMRYVCSLKQDPGRIVILGATGKREDHSIGNIFHLIDFAELCESVSMVTDEGTFEPVLPPGRTLHAPCGTAVSVFAPMAGTEMTSKGLKWQLDGTCLDALWKGTLNRTTAEAFEICATKPAIVFVAFR